MSTDADTTATGESTSEGGQTAATDERKDAPQ
jgi:hypothetical protein